MSQKNEVTQTSNQIIVENHDDIKYLLVYHIKEKNKNSLLSQLEKL